MEQKAVLGVPWTVVSFASNKLLTTATTLVLVHLLAPSDFGLIALAMIVINLLFWFGGLGFANALIVRQDLDIRGQGTAFTLMLGSGIAAAGVAGPSKR